MKTQGKWRAHLTPSEAEELGLAEAARDAAAENLRAVVKRLKSRADRRWQRAEEKARKSVPPRL